MNRFKKIMLSVLAITAATAAVCGISACDDGEEKKPDNGGDEGTEATISYQFTGNYTDETLTGLGFDYYIILNLYSDNTVAGSGYNKLSMDSSAYTDNSGFYEKWWKGTWEETENEEGLECIELKVRYDSDAQNIMGGGLLTGNFEYQLYEGADGNITFTIDCPIFSGRKQEITGSSTVRYNDLNAFIQGNLYQFEEPDYVTMFQSTGDSITSRIYCQEDGTALFCTGKEDPATETEKYLISETWTWTYADGALTFAKSATEKYTATLDGNSATVNYEVSLMGNTMKYTLACADISDLKEIGGAQQPEAPVVLATFTSEGGDTITVYKDGTAKMSAYGGALKPSFNWSYAGGTLTFTDAENAQKVYTATISGNSATVVYADKLGDISVNISFTCDDISALIK